jgi:hypothetical protein
VAQSESSVERCQNDQPGAWPQWMDPSDRLSECVPRQNSTRPRNQQVGRASTRCNLLCTWLMFGLWLRLLPRAFRARRDLLIENLALRQKLGLLGVTWHLLRHSYATMLDGVGTPVGTMQSLLGHSAPEITREIYLHAIPEEQRRAVESVERLVFGPKWTQVTELDQSTSGAVN